MSKPAPTKRNPPDAAPRPSLNKATRPPRPERPDANTSSRGRTRSTVRAEFKRLEAVVHAYHEARIEAGRALREIKDRALYKKPHTEHETFEAYVENTYPFGVRNAQFLINLAKDVDAYVAAGVTPPVTAAQSRALRRLDEGVRLETWERLVAEHGTPEAVSAPAIEACKPAPIETSEGDESRRQVDGSTEGWPADARSALRQVPVGHREVVARHANAFAAEAETDVERWIVDEVVTGYAAAVLEDGADGPPSLVGEAARLAAEVRLAATESSRPAGTRDAPILDLDVLPDLEHEPKLKQSALFLGSHERSPLLVSVPRVVLPEALAAELAHDNLRSVVVEISELHRLAGPVDIDGRGRHVLRLDEVRAAAREAGVRAAIQVTNALVDWARRTTNPLVGCRHACRYTFCYAAGIARRLFAQGFLPTLMPARLDAFSRASLPDVSALSNEAAWMERSVFVVSMGDLFGRWVPEWYVESVLAEIELHPGWFCFLLTKHPERLGDFDFPSNCAVGLTITGDEASSADDQARIYRESARAIERVHGAAFTWLSLEPFRGEVHDLTPFFDAGIQMVAVGGQSRTVLDPPQTGDPLIIVPAAQPDIRWLERVRAQTDGARVHRFEKENVTVRRKDIPFPTDRPA